MVDSKKDSGSPTDGPNVVSPLPNTSQLVETNVSTQTSKRNLRSGKALKGRQKSEYGARFIKQPEYQEFSNTKNFQSRKKLGGGVYWVLDALCSCDWSYLPSELQFFLQSHPKLTLTICYSLTFSILVIVVAMGYMYYDLAHEAPRTFSWRALSTAFLMPGTYSNKKVPGLNGLSNISLHLNCSIYESEHYYTSIRLSPILDLEIIQTLHISALLSLKCQGSFLGIALLIICIQFFYTVSVLKDEMRDEMNEFTAAGISAWWQTTQEKSKCCGLDRPADWKKVTPNFWALSGQKYPLSCCDVEVSASKCTELPVAGEIFTTGCYEKERHKLDLHGALLIVAIAWIIQVSVGLIYLFEGVEIFTRRKWKRPNSSYDSTRLSLETFGSVEIVSLDGTTYYSMLEIHNDDFNPFTDGIYDFKYDYEYDIEFQRGEFITGKAVIETSNSTERNLKLELEFDETKGTVTMIY
ncbi:unnamed protein product [Allacma fusca]|uniref:Tetraspanin n=1 Tax=Allacma fusca TaxID=39272 RepID=A0A8J2LAS4_9HEXA|nr:unnamed protein product [Allacma fusca]